MEEKTKQQLEQEFESSNKPLILINSKYKIENINKMALDKLGYSKEEIVGKKVLFIHTKDYENICQKKIDSVINGEKAVCDCPYVTKNKEYILSKTTLEYGFGLF